MEQSVDSPEARLLSAVQMDRPWSIYDTLMADKSHVYRQDQLPFLLELLQKFPEKGAVTLPTFAALGRMRQEAEPALPILHKFLQGYLRDGKLQAARLLAEVIIKIDPGQELDFTVQRARN